MVFLLYFLEKKSVSTIVLRICHEFAEDKKPLKLFRVVGLEVVCFVWILYNSEKQNWYQNSILLPGLAAFPACRIKLNALVFVRRKKLTGTKTMQRGGCFLSCLPYLEIQCKFTAGTLKKQVLVLCFPIGYEYTGKYIFACVFVWFYLYIHTDIL